MIRPRVTSNGWLLGAASSIAVIAGRVVALPEVALLGMVGLAILASCWVLHLVRATTPLIERQVRPRRVTQGQSVELSLSVRAPGRRAVPASHLHDTVDKTPLPTQFIAPVRPGSPRRVISTVLATQRGIARLGPIAVTMRDPLGLSEATTLVPLRDEVIVWPRVEALTRTNRTAASGAETATLSSLFHAPTVDDAPRLREYQPGDDVRRVHWPSTARLGTPVVREVDRPADNRTIVVLDVRRAHHDGPSFERAIVAAASVVCDRVATGEPVRLITTTGTDSGPVNDRRALERVLDDLAALQPQAGGSFVGVLRTLRASASDGVVIACVGSSLDPADLAEFDITSFGRAGVLISCGDAPVADRTGDEIRFGSNHRLAEQWELAMRQLERGAS